MCSNLQGRLLLRLLPSSFLSTRESHPYVNQPTSVDATGKRQWSSFNLDISRKSVMFPGLFFFVYIKEIYFEVFGTTSFSETWFYLFRQSPSSHARDKRKELKEPFTTEWGIQWTNLLTVEEADGNTQVLLHLRHSSKQFTQVVSCNPPNGSETPQATEIHRAVQQQWRAICPTPEDPSKSKVRNRLIPESKTLQMPS